MSKDRVNTVEYLRSVPESRLFDARDAVLVAFPFIGTLSSNIEGKRKTTQEERVERIMMRSRNQDVIAAEVNFDNDADDPIRWSAMLRAAVYGELQDGYASAKLRARREQQT